MTCPGARQNPARPAKKLAKTVGKRYFSALLALWPPRERLKPAKKLQKACPGPTQRAHDLPRSSPEPGKACPRPPKASRGAREGLPRAVLGCPGPSQELAEPSKACPRPKSSGRPVQGRPRTPRSCPRARQNPARPAQGRPRSAEEPRKAAQAAHQGRHNCRELLERFGQLCEAIQ